MSSNHFSESRLWGICLVAAPVLMFLSGFYWVDGEYGITGASLLVLSTVCWIPVLLFLFSKTSGRFPVLSPVVFLLGTYGFISGAIFASLGFFSTVFQIKHEDYVKILGEYPVASGILLFWSGPLAPMSLLIAGILLLMTRKTATWISVLLILGAIAFPASRIPRNPNLAHLADVLLAIPLIYMGIKALAENKTNGLPSGTP